MTFSWLLFSLAFVVVVIVLVWVKRAQTNRFYVRNEIIMRLGCCADKDYLITNSLINEARKTLKSGNHFEVVYQPQMPGCWEHNHLAMTGDASCDCVIGGTNVYEQEILEGLGEITDEVLREHPEIKEWLRWKEGIPETLVILTKYEKSAV